MTSADLRAWQAQMGHTYDSAAKALGVSRATYARYLQSNEIPKYIGLACSALSANLTESGTATSAQMIDKINEINEINEIIDRLQ